MNFSSDDLPENPTPNPNSADAVPVWGRASSPVQAEQGSADSTGQSGASGVPFDASHFSDGQPSVPFDVASPDPAWTGLDILRLMVLIIVAIIACFFAAVLITRICVYPHMGLGEIARIPLVAVAGQSLAYLLIFGYMYVLVTRERRRPDFLAAIHWNWPSNIAAYVVVGFALSLALQVLAHFLPIPKELPIDSFFRTPAEAWALSILSVTLAPLMEELFFRGFLYPVLARRLGLPIAVFLTALGFALLHVAQLGRAWGPVLLIFLVGIVLTLVRAKTNSVAAGVLIHMAYNGTITVAMFAATDGFRHLEKLNQ
jgi:CAAX protease family protein